MPNPISSAQAPIDIDIMPAGREMDALIAERVMKLIVDYEFEILRVPALADKYDEWGYLPNYSTDIAAAWDIVKELQGRGYWIVLYDYHTIPSSVPYHFCFSKDGYTYSRGGETVEISICRAALKAVGQ